MDIEHRAGEAADLCVFVCFEKIFEFNFAHALSAPSDTPDRLILIWSYRGAWRSWESYLKDGVYIKLEWK